MSDAIKAAITASMFSNNEIKKIREVAGSLTTSKAPASKGAYLFRENGKTVFKVLKKDLDKHLPDLQGKDVELIECQDMLFISTKGPIMHEFQSVVLSSNRKSCSFADVSNLTGCIVLIK